MLTEALDDKDNIIDDGDNIDNDDGEGRLVAVLGTVHLPSTTFHCFLCTTTEPQYAPQYTTMHH